MSESSKTLDSLCLVGASLFGDENPPSDLFAEHRAANIGGAVLTTNRPLEYTLAVGNNEVASLIAQTPNNFRQLARVDPNYGGTEEEIVRCINDLRVSGFYLNPQEEFFQINGTKAILTLEKIAATELPVVIEAGVNGHSEAFKAGEIASIFPRTDFILTNGGQLNMSGLGQVEVLKVLEQCPNIRIFTSGMYRQDFLESVVDRFGAERLIFASHSPRFSPEYEILRVLGGHFSTEQRRLILHENARQLFFAAH